MPATAETMTLKYTELVKLFEALGVDTAEGWGVAKMTAKVREVERFKSPDKDLADPNLADLYEDLVELNRDEGEFTVQDDRPAKPKRPTKTPTNGKPAAKAKPATKPAKKVSQAWKPGDPPLPFAEGRGRGQTRYIVELLRKAGEDDKPLTKEAIHAKLKAKFKDADEKKMWTTLANQVPSRLRIVRGIHVWKDSRGYFIDPKTGGSKPQEKRTVADSSKTTNSLPKGGSGGNKASAKKPAATAKKPAAGAAKKGASKK